MKRMASRIRVEKDSGAAACNPSSTNVFVVSERMLSLRTLQLALVAPAVLRCAGSANARCEYKVREVSILRCLRSWPYSPAYTTSYADEWRRNASICVLSYYLFLPRASSTADFDFP